MTFFEEVKRPFNLVTMFFTIVSLILSIIFYYNGIRDKEISYSISEPTALIFDSKNSSSSIKLIERDSIIITDNVYLLTGSIINTGDLPISKSDLRKNLSILLPKAKRILDYKITKQKDPSISKFNLSILNKNALKIRWNYFDPNAGFNFQIIYIGKEDPNFTLNGKVLGIEEFQKIKLDKAIDIKLYLGLAIMYLILVAMLIWRIAKTRVNYNRKKYYIIYWVMLSTTTSVLIYLIVKVINIQFASTFILK
ncbi:hypothetical protein [Flavobacterium sp. N1736]|uniref:hypothetical protein n=1 Tax=Flavobacterium sp. N1736 TaxID=2986823 RepID=UPI0022248C30|nr:hypothetical protein [Flavobacterium sp. N1736]